ncbi:hypothetical protein [Olleya namhaensis]|uniref:hypothetical protein n=1 Tax=Olleya namhaensis TaxID=1144750 RepID=UPI00249328DE|nr:hypothetical protein [Olleya namhaensis]
MKTINLEQYESISGGNDIVDGLCTAAGIASIVAMTNFWNPVGWVAGALAVGDVACLAYGIGEHL